MFLRFSISANADADADADAYKCRWADEHISRWTNETAYADADADAVTLSSNTRSRSYIRRSVPSSLWRSFLVLRLSSPFLPSIQAGEKVADKRTDTEF